MSPTVECPHCAIVFIDHAAFERHEPRCPLRGESAKPPPVREDLIADPDLVPTIPEGERGGSAPV